MLQLLFLFFETQWQLPIPLESWIEAKDSHRVCCRFLHPQEEERSFERKNPSHLVVCFGDIIYIIYMYAYMNILKILHNIRAW